MVNIHATGSDLDFRVVVGTGVDPVTFRFSDVSYASVEVCFGSL